MMKIIIERAAGPPALTAALRDFLPNIFIVVMLLHLFLMVVQANASIALCVIFDICFCCSINCFVIVLHCACIVAEVIVMLAMFRVCGLCACWCNIVRTVP